MTGGDGEQGAATSVAVMAAIEAENEFVEVGLEVLAAQAVIDTQRPGFEIGKDAVGPGEHDMSSHLADRMRVVVNAWGASITGPAVCLGGSTGGEIGRQEGMQAGSRVIGHLLKADTAGTGPAVLHFDRTATEDFALMLGH